MTAWRWIRPASPSTVRRATLTGWRSSRRRIDAEVARIQRDGVSADELERAKNRLVRGMIFAQDSPSSMANMYGSALTTGNTVKDVREWPDRIKAVTAEQVQAAAVKFLKSDQSVTAYLLASPETSN